MSAYYYGLAKCESAHTFLPNRNVSREKFVVMTARVAELTKLGYFDAKDAVIVGSK